MTQSSGFTAREIESYFNNAAFTPIARGAQPHAAEAELRSRLIIETLGGFAQGNLSFNKIQPEASFAVDAAFLNTSAVYRAVQGRYAIEVAEIAHASPDTPALRYITAYDRAEAGQKGTVAIWAPSTGPLDVRVMTDKLTNGSFAPDIFHPSRVEAVRLVGEVIEQIRASVNVAPSGKKATVLKAAKV